MRLWPGKSRRAKLSIPAAELALWNQQKECVIEPATFSVMAGASAEDDDLCGSFEVMANKRGN